MNGRLFHLEVTVFLTTIGSSTRNDYRFYHERRSHLLSLPMGRHSGGDIYGFYHRRCSVRRLQGPDGSTSTWLLVAENARVAYGFI
jgi:hypothetical protein